MTTNINTATVQHPPIFSVEQARQYLATVQAASNNPTAEAEKAQAEKIQGRTLKSHSFSKVIARECGVPAALVAKYLAYRVKNSHKAHDGHNWHYETVMEMAVRYPYMSSSCVYDALQKLKKKKIILIGRYNKWSADRTSWFSFPSPEMQAQAEKNLLYFDPDEATKHGITAAIILGNINYWVAYNRKTKPDYHWHPISVVKLEKLLPFSRSTLLRTLQTLVKTKVLAKNPENKDKTQQYSVNPPVEPRLAIPEITLATLCEAVSNCTPASATPNGEALSPIEVVSLPCGERLNSNSTDPSPSDSAAKPVDYTTLEIIRRNSLEELRVKDFLKDQFLALLEISVKEKGLEETPLSNFPDLSPEPPKEQSKLAQSPPVETPSVKQPVVIAPGQNKKQEPLALTAATAEEEVDEPAQVAQDKLAARIAAIKAADSTGDEKQIFVDCAIEYSWAFLHTINTDTLIAWHSLHSPDQLWAQLKPILACHLNELMLSVSLSEEGLQEVRDVIRVAVTAAYRYWWHSEAYMGLYSIPSALSTYIINRVKPILDQQREEALRIAKEKRAYDLEQRKITFQSKIQALETDPTSPPYQKLKVLQAALISRNQVGCRGSKATIETDFIPIQAHSFRAAKRFFAANPSMTVAILLALVDRAIELKESRAVELDNREMPSETDFDFYFYTRKALNLSFLLIHLKEVFDENIMSDILPPEMEVNFLSKTELFGKEVVGENK